MEERKRKAEALHKGNRDDRVRTSPEKSDRRYGR